MKEKSASAEGAIRGVAAPRWILEAWLWLNVPATLFEYYVCDAGVKGSWCSPAVPVSMFVSKLFPMSLREGIPPSVPAPFAWGLLILATAGCHWALRRKAPAYIQLRYFLLLVVAWELLTWATLFLSVMSWELWRRLDAT